MAECGAKKQSNTVVRSAKYTKRRTDNQQQRKQNQASGFRRHHGEGILEDNLGRVVIDIYGMPVDELMKEILRAVSLCEQHLYLLPYLSVG